MKRIFSALVFVALVPLSAQSQNEATRKILLTKAQSSIDLTGGAGAGVFAASLGVSRTHGLLASKKLRVGYGLRCSAFSGNDLTYITAPFALTQDPATIDSLIVGKPLTIGLNAGIHLGYFITPKLMVGFNIDAVGVGFGANGISTFQSSENDGTYPTSVRTAPTAFNLLLVGDNDIGHLKSEFVIAYDINDKIRLRAGGDFTFSEVTTAQVLTNDNDRFRYKAMMGFVGLSYIFESKSAE